MRRIDAATLKGWIKDGQELAILDAREDGEFGKSHLFWANPCGLSRAELRARALLPRPGVRIACVDGGEGGLAERLAGYLEGIGCTDVAVLDGGTKAWAAAGYVLFSGMNVPSKAFGEWVEHHYHTPSVDPGELRAMIEAGEDMVILDSRPMDEFHRMSIPGAIDVPGGELVYRIGEIAPDPQTTIVVNCAGRTRSIMGAESLRSAGVPNKVVALRNGTMGWELAGFSCDSGKTASYPRGVPGTLGTALERATAFASRWGVKTIDRAGLAALLADGSRTTHVLDVRDPAEYAAGHLAGSRSAPGGQLVQGTDNWVAVRGARIVLVDDTGCARPDDRRLAAPARPMGGVRADRWPGRPAGGRRPGGRLPGSRGDPRPDHQPGRTLRPAGRGWRPGGAALPLDRFPRGPCARRALGRADPAGEAGPEADRRPHRGGGRAGGGGNGGHRPPRGARIAGAGAGPGEAAGRRAGGLEGGRAAAGEEPPGPGGCRLHRRLSPPL